jgi:hypothetical protein
MAAAESSRKSHSTFICPPAANVPAAFPPPAAPHRWWSGPVELGQATGGAAATAGRATASLLERLGSRVPELFTP